MANATQPWTCEECGELVEARFTCCWNCGRQLDGTYRQHFHTADDYEAELPNIETKGLDLRSSLILLTVGILFAFYALRRRASFPIVAVCLLPVGYAVIQITGFLLPKLAHRIRAASRKQK